jgi:hypothetical protein
MGIVASGQPVDIADEIWQAMISNRAIGVRVPLLGRPAAEPPA